MLNWRNLDELLRFLPKDASDLQNALFHILSAGRVRTYSPSAVEMDIKRVELPTVQCSDGPYIGLSVNHFIPMEALIPSPASIMDFNTDKLGLLYHARTEFAFMSMTLTSDPAFGGSASNVCEQIPPELASLYTVSEYSNGKWLRDLRNGVFDVFCQHNGPQQRQKRGAPSAGNRAKKQRRKRSSDSDSDGGGSDEDSEDGDSGVGEDGADAASGNRAGNYVLTPEQKLAASRLPHSSIKREFDQTYRVAHGSLDIDSKIGFYCIPVPNRYSGLLRDLQDLAGVLLVFVPRDLNVRMNELLMAMTRFNRKLWIGRECTSQQLVQTRRTLYINPDKFEMSSYKHMRGVGELVDMINACGDIPQPLTPVSVDCSTLRAMPDDIMNFFCDFRIVLFQMQHYMKDGDGAAVFLQDPFQYDALSGRYFLQWPVPEAVFCIRAPEHLYPQQQRKQMLPWLLLRFVVGSDNNDIRVVPLSEAIAAWKSCSFGQRSVALVLNSAEAGLSARVVRNDGPELAVHWQLAQIVSAFMGRVRLLSTSRVRELKPVINYCEYVEHMVFEACHFSSHPDANVSNAAKAIYKWLQDFNKTRQPMAWEQHPTALGLSPFGNYISTWLLTLDTVYKVYNAHLPIMFAFLASCTPFDTSLAMALHLIFSGTPGTSKSHVVTMLTWMLIEGTLQNRTGNTAKSEYLKNTLQDSQDVAARDEGDPWYFMNTVLTPDMKAQLYMMLSKMTQRQWARDVSQAVLADGARGKITTGGHEMKRLSAMWYCILLMTTNETRLNPAMQSRVVQFISDNQPARSVPFSVFASHTPTAREEEKRQHMNHRFNRKHALITMYMTLKTSGCVPAPSFELFHYYYDCFTNALARTGIVMTDNRFAIKAKAHFSTQTIDYASHLAFASPFSPFIGNVERDPLTGKITGLKMTQFNYGDLHAMGPFMAPNAELTIWSLLVMFGNAINNTDGTLLGVISKYIAGLDISRLRQLIVAYDHNARCFGYNHAVAVQNGEISQTRCSVNTVSKCWYELERHEQRFLSYLTVDEYACPPLEDLLQKRPVNAGTSVADETEYMSKLAGWRSEQVRIGRELVSFSECLDASGEYMFAAPMKVDATFSTSMVPTLLIRPGNNNTRRLDPNYVVIGVGMTLDKIVRNITSRLALELMMDNNTEDGLAQPENKKGASKSAAKLEHIKTTIEQSLNMTAVVPSLPMVNPDNFTMARLAAMLHPASLQTYEMRQTNVMELLSISDVDPTCLTSYRSSSSGAGRGHQEEQVLVMSIHRPLDMGHWVKACLDSVMERNTPENTTIIVPMSVPMEPHLMTVYKMGPKQHQHKPHARLHTSKKMNECVWLNAADMEKEDSDADSSDDENDDVEPYNPDVETRETAAIRQFNKLYRLDHYERTRSNHAQVMGLCLAVLYGMVEPTPELVAIFRSNIALSKINDETWDYYRRVGAKIAKRGRYPTDFAESVQQSKERSQFSPPPRPFTAPVRADDDTDVALN